MWVGEQGFDGGKRSGFDTGARCVLVTAGLLGALVTGCTAAPAPRAAKAGVASVSDSPPTVSSTATARASARPTAATPPLAPSPKCNIESVPELEASRVEWQRTVARSAGAYISALAPRARGVLVGGGDSQWRASATAFAVSLDRDGRERYRVHFDEPRSDTSPQQARVRSLAALDTGEAYVLVTATKKFSIGAASLALLGARGERRFTLPLDFFGELLALAPDGAVVVAGELPSGKGLRLVKYDHAGKRAWEKTFLFTGTPARLLRVRDHFLLVSSFQGVAEFGATRLTRTEQLEYRCAGSELACPARATSLLVAAFDEVGDPLWARLFGSASQLFLASDMVVTPDERLLVTGEYAGPPLTVGKGELCELQAGMPEPDPSGFRELGDAWKCRCRHDRRDLFVLELDQDGEPRWAKTLALGSPAPAIAVSTTGEIRWAAHVWQQAAATERGALELELWSLVDDGTVSARRVTPGGLGALALEDRLVFLSDEHSVRAVRW